MSVLQSTFLPLWLADLHPSLLTTTSSSITFTMHSMCDTQPARRHETGLLLRDSLDRIHPFHS